VPNWVAPNVITLAGFGCMLVSYFISAYYAPNFREFVPPWVHLAAALGLFLYQTMDAIDGMQARKTGVTGPVGEFLDNFVDIPSMMLALLVLSGGMRFDGFPLFYVVLSLIANHFAILWETNHTKQMSFGIGTNSVTEGQLVIIALNIISFFNDTIWDWDVAAALGITVPQWLLSALGQPITLKVVVICVSAGLLNGLAFIASFIRSVKSDSHQSVGTAVSQMLPLALVLLFSVGAVFTSPTNILMDNPRLVMTLLVFLECMLLGRMVILRQVGTPFTLFPKFLWPFPAILYNNVYQILPVPDQYLIVGYCAVLCIMTVHMFANVIYGMCTSLGVPFLTVPKKPIKKNA